MSYIPSHAMPHTFAHEDEDYREPGGRIEPQPEAGHSMALKLAGAALAGFLVYRVLR